MARPTGLDRSPRRGRRGSRSGQDRPGGDMARSRHRSRVERRRATRRPARPHGARRHEPRRPPGAVLPGPPPATRAGARGRDPGRGLDRPPGVGLADAWPGPVTRRLLTVDIADVNDPEPGRLASARAGPVTPAGDGASGVRRHGRVPGGPLPRRSGATRRAVRPHPARRRPPARDRRGRDSRRAWPAPAGWLAAAARLLPRASCPLGRRQGDRRAGSRGAAAQRAGWPIRARPLGELPWPTKQGSTRTSLALLGRG